MATLQKIKKSYITDKIEKIVMKFKAVRVRYNEK